MGKIYHQPQHRHRGQIHRSQRHLTSRAGHQSRPEQREPSRRAHDAGRRRCASHPANRRPDAQRSGQHHRRTQGHRRRITDGEVMSKVHHGENVLPSEGLRFEPLTPSVWFRTRKSSAQADRTPNASRGAAVFGGRDSVWSARVFSTALVPASWLRWPERSVAILQSSAARSVT